jgi:hypothetical protein
MRPLGSGSPLPVYRDKRTNSEPGSMAVKGQQAASLVVSSSENLLRLREYCDTAPFAAVYLILVNSGRDCQGSVLDFVETNFTGAGPLLVP